MGDAPKVFITTLGVAAASLIRLCEQVVLRLWTGQIPRGVEGFVWDFRCFVLVVKLILLFTRTLHASANLRTLAL